MEQTCSNCYNGDMRRISTGLTFVNKRLMPGVLFAFIAVLFCSTLSAVILNKEPVFILIVPLLFGGVFYLVMKNLVFDLMDEVYLDGDALVVRNQGAEERIPLAHVINVNASVMMNPERITLTLAEPSKFGEEITFSPTHRLFPFMRHPVAKELIVRAQEARKVQAGS